MDIYFLIIFLILFNFISNDEDDEYTIQMESNLCASAEPKTCRDVKLSGNRLCCEIFETNADEIQETCEVKTTKEAQMSIVGSSAIINKELAGLAIYNEEYGGAYGDNITERIFDVQRKISITCETWDFSIDIIDGEYSDEEIKILQSDNHCLSYFNPYLKHSKNNIRNVTRDICYKALLLPSTKEYGISCGYMEIDIKEPNGKEEKRATCFLYDPNVTITKILDESSRLNLNDMTRKNEDDKITYRFTIYGPEGKGYTFSSETRQVEEAELQMGFVPEDVPSNSNYNYDKEEETINEPSKKPNYGTINKLSCCLVVLIILSWL